MSRLAPVMPRSVERFVLAEISVAGVPVCSASIWTIAAWVDSRESSVFAAGRKRAALPRSLIHL